MDYKIHYHIIEKFYSSLDFYIQNVYKKETKIVIFGTQRPSQMIRHYLKKFNIPVFAFIDNNKEKQGTVFYGVKTYLPEDILNDYDENIHILIVSQHQDAMVKQLKKMKYTKEKNIFIIMDMQKEMNDIQIINNISFSEMDASEIRNSQLSLLNYTKEVCEKNNLCYFLAGGTALGAVRHKGFIPWDDDIDVCMKLNDLKTFIQIVNEEKKYDIISIFNENEYLGSDGARLIDTKTFTYSSLFPIPLTSGISIDIFPLYGLPDDEKQKLKFIQYMSELEKEYFSSLYLKEDSEIIINKIIECMHKYPLDTASYVGYILSPCYKKENVIFKKSFFDEYILKEFEHSYYRIVKDYDGYLTTLYDNYMALPKKSERKSHHHYKAFWK